MRFSTATQEELKKWYVEEIDASAEGDSTGTLEEARAACRKAAVETLAHRAEHSFDGDKSSRGETAGSISDYIVREFKEIMGRDPTHNDAEDWDLIVEVRAEIGDK